MANIDFSIYKLKAINYYVSFQDFVTSCQNNKIPVHYYISDINYFSGAENIEVFKLDFICKFVEALGAICNYKSNDKKTLCISNNNQLEELPIKYNVEDILSMPSIGDSHYSILSILTNTQDISSKLYLKELIDFISDIPKNTRFSYLIKNIEDYQRKCICSQEVYVSNFSYNEVKLKIDNAVLDFSRKIQSVINDAQSKLIAIPVALVLAVAAIDLSNVKSVKNFATVLASYVFSFLIELFIKNQTSTLDMIGNNIDSYKKAFNKGSQINDEITESFISLDKELVKQHERLTIIRYIVWGVPVILTLGLIYALGHKFIASILTIFALLVILIKAQKKYDIHRRS